MSDAIATQRTIALPAFRFSTAETLKHVVLMLGAVIVLMPFYVMVSYSLKSPAEIMQNTGGVLGSQVPFRDDYCVKLGNPVDECMVTPAVYNYTTAFQKAPLLRYLLNGLIVTVSIFAVQVVVALPCAYALAKLRFWGREAVFGLVLFCLLIPVHAIALPLYIMLAKLGLTNTYAALIIPWTISVFGIFLMRQFFMTVPDDLIDAARMDGMSEYSIVWNVMLPVAIPALLAFGIFSVVAHWNDYFWPRIVITGDRSLFTPPLGLREFKGDADGDNFGPMMATACVIVAPLIAAFLLAQRRFIAGIALSGMK
ncbi:carbohydrate ABC transporter permease [Acuticoccus sp.]|uniref:carbohydrate ABC transporter permease n=1 Tax=Acuticoccus sp. TaxID=1904378 RepID=UPI003B515E66